MLNRKLIGLLALLLSAGLSLSACGDDDKADSNNDNPPVNEPDAAGGDEDGKTDPEEDGKTDPEEDGKTEPETGCTKDDECADGYECIVADAVCVASASGCDVTGADRPERCDQDVADAAFGPTSRVTEFEIAADDCCFDLNDDGEPNNALSLLRSLENGAVNTGIQDSIDSGSLVLLFEHEGLDDPVNSGPYTLNVWLGEAVEAPVTGPFVVDAASVDEGTFPQAFLPNAKIENGVLTAGPGVVDISLTLEGLLDAPLDLRISQAQIKATVDPTSDLADGVAINEEDEALMGGKLGGAIRVDDLVEAMNSFVIGSCDCLGLEGADYILYEDGALSCAPLTAEDNTCADDGNTTCAGLTQVCGMLPLLGSIVDVDTNGDGENDALSIGTTFNTEAATISGIGNP